VQHVDEPETWAREHQWFLNAVFAAFDEDGRWPQIETVQAALATDDVHRAVAVGQLTIDIPSEIGARHGDRIVLTVRALSLVPDAQQLLSAFTAAMRLAVDAYPGLAGAKPKLAGSNVRAALDLDDLAYRKVSTLVLAEPWVFNGGTGSEDEDWVRWIRVEVLLLRDVTDVFGYLDVIATYRWGPATQVRVQPIAVPMANAPRKWLAKRESSNRDRLIVTIGGGIVVALVAWLLLR
jgi:hypothetical protein